MAVTSVDKRWLEVNDRLCEILGYPREELLRSKWDDLTHPEDLEPNSQLFRRLLAGEIEHFTLDKRFVRRDRSIVYTTIHIRAFRRDDGTIDHFVSLTEDITARKQAEEGMRAGRAKLEAALASMTDAIFISDADGRFIDFNDAFATFHRFTDKSECLKNLADYPSILDVFLANGELAPLDQWAVPRALRGETATSAEYTLRRTDTGETWVGSYSFGPIRDQDGRIVGSVVAGRDITERKRAQDALQQNHDELRAIYDQVRDGIIILDLATLKGIRANAALCEMLGYSEEEVTTLPPERVTPPETLYIVREHVETVKKGKVARIDDQPFVRKDGSIIYADVVSSLIYYNERPCWISFLHDVTGRRQAQAARERERRTLEHMLQASDRERRLIAYDIHDGLAQELAGAIMQFEAFDHLKEAKPKQANDAYHAGMTILRQGHAEARRLISGVRPLILDEAGVLAAIAHLIREPAFAKGPTVDFRSRVTFNRLAPVLEDVVYRIVQEGLSNARNHSKSPKILVSLLQRGDRLRVKIQDWGVGFDPKTVQENRFGLEGIRERARVLRGKCSIKSKPGEGTVVVVELPVVEQEVE